MHRYCTTLRHRWYAGQSEGAGPCLASGQCMWTLNQGESVCALILLVFYCLFAYLQVLHTRPCLPKSMLASQLLHVLMTYAHEQVDTHSSIGLKPTSALQAACRHAMHSTQFMLIRMLPSVSHMPAPQYHVLIKNWWIKNQEFMNQWQIYKQGGSFSFVYGPCTSKSFDWLHLMTYCCGYNISCSISHTVVLSRLTVVRQGMSSYRYNWEF